MVWDNRNFKTFISTHTSLAGRDQKENHQFLVSPISTHTSLAGRDQNYTYLLSYCQISTHTSLAGRDQHAKKEAQ